MELLAAPELTRHGVEILNTLPILREAPVSRAKAAQIRKLRIVLRSPAQPDVVMDINPDTARFELVHQHADGDAIVVTEPAHRLLSIWGRRAPDLPVTVIADPKLWASVATSPLGRHVLTGRALTVR